MARRPIVPATLTADPHSHRDNAVEETHPAYAVMKVNRRTGGDGSLFDSDIRHNETVVLSVHRASRTRDLHRDWIHGEMRPVVEVQMSLAQWASAVSSFGLGEGVPVTLLATEDEPFVPGIEFEPRLALSMEEAKTAAHDAFADIQAAMAAVDALDPKAPAAERRAAMSRLRTAIGHSDGKVDFAAKSLVEHAENVVQKSRADVEAYVVNAQAAVERGLTAGPAPSIALDAGLTAIDAEEG